MRRERFANGCQVVELTYKDSIRQTFSEAFEEDFRVIRHWLVASSCDLLGTASSHTYIVFRNPPQTRELKSNFPT